MRWRSASYLAAVSAVVGLGGANPGGAADAQSLAGDRDQRLPFTRYVTMQPFVLPLMENGEHRRQVTLVVALEMMDEGDREELQRLAPKFRDGMYQALFKLLTFRTAKPRIPHKPVIKRKLEPVAKRVAGDLVKSVLVHKVIVNPRP